MILGSRKVGGRWWSKGDGFWEEEKCIQRSVKRGEGVGFSRDKLKGNGGTVLKGKQGWNIEKLRDYWLVALTTRKSVDFLKSVQ